MGKFWLKRDIKTIPSGVIELERQSLSYSNRIHLLSALKGSKGQYPPGEMNNLWWHSSAHWMAAPAKATKSI